MKLYLFEGTVKDVTHGKVRAIGIATRIDLLNYISNTKENKTETESPTITLKQAQKE